MDDEIARLVCDAGMKPMDAIRAASAVGARTLGEQSSMGTIEPGKLANFVMLQGDPVVDIGNIRSVETVVKHRVQYARDVYRPVTVEEMRESPSE